MEINTTTAEPWVSSILGSDLDASSGYFERNSLPKVVLYGLLVALVSQSVIYVKLTCDVYSVLLLTVSKRLWRAYSTTLRKIPGPFHAKITGLALKWHDVQGTRWFYVQDLHKKYGTTVRIAPYEIAISDPKVVRKVHGFGTEFRKRQQPGTAFNIFSLSDPKIHRTRQRFYNHCFSQENLLQNNEPAVLELANMTVDGIKREVKENGSSVADMFKWCMLFGYDVAFQVVYGHTNGLIATNKGTDEVIMGFHLQRLNSWMLFSFPLFLLGRWFSPFSATLKDIFRVEWRYADIFQAGQRQRDIAAKTVFVKNTKYKQDETEVFAVSDDVKLSAYDIAHDITTFLGAGGEAVGATLVYLVWQVLKMPELQKELEAEVAGLTEPITDAACAPLPVLNGVIYEALRLFGGGATHLPRYSPHDTDLGGYVVPAGVAVTSHACALHRNPAAWENPDA
ncbi:MAG: hypothetical protein OHK93_002076 [Ramalina farinacea]|uniref:Cytochrome P450 n=1 Tax=Ramalina farinacea TaxID=258253 RepID=A0AA43QTE2_9LECA|nr:hypothetical protein [Ramalina farinacea]